MILAIGLVACAPVAQLEVALWSVEPLPAFEVDAVTLRPEGMEWGDDWESLPLLRESVQGVGAHEPVLVARGSLPTDRYLHLFPDVAQVRGAEDIVEPIACDLSLRRDRRLLVELLLWPTHTGEVGLFAVDCVEARPDR